MRFLENFKAKRAAKKAQQKYDLELTQWQQEEELRTHANSNTDAVRLEVTRLGFAHQIGMA
jgi:hypothetical protein